MSTKKMVYLFDQGSAEMKNLLGSKGANLAEMSRIGLPVPPGFVITTEACNRYYEVNRQIWPELEQEVRQCLEVLQSTTGRRFGGEEPLLLSVRSGAVISMPGMMDTVLNLGLNRETVEGLARESGNRRFALDCYRRFIQMFGDVVLKVERNLFESVLEAKKEAGNLSSDAELSEDDLEAIIASFLEIVRREAGREFPTDPWEQLLLAIKAVFDSWHTPRAKVYRQANRIPDNLGTGVNVQVMVFGNLGDDSCTGVAFTRNPSTGEAKLYGEYLLNAQGEDVVSGARTPRPIVELKEEMPAIYEQFVSVCRTLESHYHEMQDIEFTVEKGKLYILQTRTGKRTAPAAVKIAVEMVREGVISREEALQRVDPAQLEQLLHRRIDPEAKLDVIARGLPASPGAASGRLVFSADRAQELAEEGEKVLLVSTETTPDDIHGILAAQGVLTSRGGMTSHAAVVARGMGKPCVCGCEELKVNLEAGFFRVGEQEFREGDLLTIDGATGQVIRGEVPLIEPQLTPEFKELLGWADQVRRLAVRANADNPEDARVALELGAQGIGLCRTEHMFMAPERIPVVQKMILASTLEERERQLERLLPMQKEDFKGIFQAMAGYPVTIRLLDPPLHEFLPDRDEVLLEVHRLRQQGAETPALKEQEQLLQQINNLAEFNPMLGQRGCRLGLAYPEIYRMQVKAIFQAALELIDEGMNPEEIKPEIMIPLVGHREELVQMRQLVQETAAQVLGSRENELAYLVGTMIELPRACLVADQLAEVADFYSFGTNDLTQTTLGYSRDDAEAKFLPFYLRQEILAANPFMEIDRDGVGQLVDLAVQKSRSRKPEIKLGVCGEHGGDPSSIAFFNELGLGYVSCSPYRVPIARLAAARAVLNK